MNSYDASGRKLAARNFTNVVALSQPLNEGEVLKHVVDENERVYISSVHNIGNVEYNSLTTYNFSTASAVESIQFSKLYNSEGYVAESSTHPTSQLTNPEYYYFCRDHLGNIREVWRGNRRTVVQRTQYYPSGLPWAKNAGDDTELPANANNRKYNGKEWVEMHGLDEYYYVFRNYFASIMRFNTVDPLAELTPGISPYAYCFNNPVRYIDPLGLTGHDTSKDMWGRDKFDSFTGVYIPPYARTGGITAQGYGDSNHGRWETTTYYSRNFVVDKYGNVHNSSSMHGQTVTTFIWDSQEEKMYGMPREGGGIPKWVAGFNTGIGAFNLSNGLKTEFMEYAVRSNYKSARTWSEFNKLRTTQQAWRTTNTLGKTGASFLKGIKGLGYVGAGLTTTYSVANAGVYYYNGGVDWKVGTKATLDVIMTGVGFFGPIGFGISATYFMLDLTTGGFGGFGEIKQ